MNLFEESSLVKICAPMVRYSKLPFRLLVKEYDCDLRFTPMIIADSFVKSEECRKSEFSTSKEDKPLIVQFAANDPCDFASAAELVYKDANGVDLNCGCPQGWAQEDGLGACMLKSPERIADILKQTRNRISDPMFSVSVKIRVFTDTARTVDMCRQLEAAGISFVSVHGRTIKERSQPVRLETIGAIVDALHIPVVANGDIDSIDKAYEVQRLTGVRGVMSARSILENPGLFAGHRVTPTLALKRWIQINSPLNTHFTLFHRHLIHMTSHILNKNERKVFNQLKSTDEVILFLSSKFNFDLNEPEPEVVNYECDPI